MPSLADYDPDTQKFSPIRTIEIETGWGEQKLRKFLTTHPHACIYTTLSHSPNKGDQIIIDGEPYVDMFGLHVYIDHQVSWYKENDVDERFNYDEYPEELEGELNDYFISR